MYAQQWTKVVKLKSHSLFVVTKQDAQCAGLLMCPPSDTDLSPSHHDLLAPVVPSATPYFMLLVSSFSS